jgi:hypothetical protein
LLVAVAQVRRQGVAVDLDRVALVADEHLVGRVTGRGLRERRLEVVGGAVAADADRQLVGVADEARPGSAAAAASSAPKSSASQPDDLLHLGERIHAATLVIEASPRPVKRPEQLG